MTKAHVHTVLMALSGLGMFVLLLVSTRQNWSLERSFMIFGGCGAAFLFFYYQSEKQKAKEEGNDNSED